MNTLDWIIAMGFFVALTGIQIYVIRYVRSATDFLAAGRLAGRYLLTVADGAAGLGAISVIASFELHYNAGLSPLWWSWLYISVQIGIALSGWIIYRFRQTRAMTMAQFFEIRYSKNFRVYAGIICFISGLLNFAVFPAVGTRFLIYFCGLPETFPLLGFDASSYAVIMAVLISISVFYTFGGMAAVIVTDFFQGITTYIVMMSMVIFLMLNIGWDRIAETLMTAPAGQSLVNPFDTSDVKDFNIWFFIIAVFAMIYGYKAWQGQQGYNCSARTPHEARMGGILGTWRIQFLSLLLATLPILSFAFYHHTDFADQAAVAQNVLAQIEDDAVRVQMTVPVALSQMLSHGFLGCFCAVMLCSFIITHDTYLHSWGTLFIQDIYLPLSKKKLEPAHHIKLMKISIVGVAIFIYIFSLIFSVKEYILLYFAITSAIYVGGAGACIIGGLFWKHGTASAAWTALIIGPILAFTGLITRALYPDFPVNSQWMLLITIVTCSSSYIIVSLLHRTKPFNVDRMLHRGKYAIADEETDQAPLRGWKAVVGMSNEFTRSDRIVYIGTMSWVLGWSLIFICATTYAVVFGISSETWLKFWKIYIFMGIGIGVLFIVWFTIGGLGDIRYLFRKLKTSARDYSDTGEIEDGAEEANGGGTDDNDTLGDDEASSGDSLCRSGKAD